MQSAKVKEFYKSGFPKEVTRGKYNFKINERLKKARNRMNLSSARVVAELKKQGVKVGHSTLQGYEANEKSLNHRYPSLPTLIGLAEFYGCSLDYLFGFSDKFKSTSLSSDTELKDVLESETNVTFNGKRLNKKQRAMIQAKLEEVLSGLE